MRKFVEKISREDILAKISEKDIFEKYMGESISIGKKYRNPFRNDKTPGCYFKVSSSSGRLLFYDHATDKVYYDCFDFAHFRTGLSGTELYNHIYYDLRLELRANVIFTESKPTIKEKTTIKTLLTKFNDFDYKYWEQYNITPSILNFFNVRKCAKTWINDYFWKASTENNPIYRYRQKDKIKLYRPLERNKENKFRNNYEGGILDGWLQLPYCGDTVFIQKALKDVMAMYSLGYSAVGVRSETTMISKNSLELLKSRFKNVIPYMDKDEAGLKMLEKYEKEFGLKGIHHPLDKPKDASDWIKENINEYQIWLEKELERYLKK